MCRLYRVRPIRAIGNWIEGCTDESACNYNSEVNLPNSTLCEYPEQSYDCDGNITEYVIGMEAEGGIVFYVDETGEHGLVAALEDLGHYEWGSIGVVIDGAIGTSIGTGYQNTIAIVNQGCIPQNNGKIAAQAALDYETSIYDDWYLPSKDELFEIYNTIGEMLVKEIEMIKNALNKHHGKRKGAATELGISERTLYRKIKQYDL